MRPRNQATPVPNLVGQFGHCTPVAACRRPTPRPLLERHPGRLLSHRLDSGTGSTVLPAGMHRLRSRPVASSLPLLLGLSSSQSSVVWNVPRPYGGDLVQPLLTSFFL